jgi:sulfur carrier protein ThiS
MKVSFFGPVQVPPPEVVATAEREFSGGTVRDLLAALGFGPEQVWFLSVVRGDERLAPEDRVEAGDELSIMLVVGGG